MNKTTEFKFSSLDTVMSATMVTLMTVGCAVLIASQGFQAVVA